MDSFLSLAMVCFRCCCCRKKGESTWGPLQCLPSPSCAWNAVSAHLRVLDSLSISFPKNLLVSFTH